MLDMQTQRKGIPMAPYLSRCCGEWGDHHLCGGKCECPCHPANAESQHAFLKQKGVTPETNFTFFQVAELLKDYGQIQVAEAFRAIMGRLMNVTTSSKTG